MEVQLEATGCGTRGGGTPRCGLVTKDVSSGRGGVCGAELVCCWRSNTDRWVGLGGCGRGRNLCRFVVMGPATTIPSFGRRVARRRKTQSGELHARPNTSYPRRGGASASA
eukprot:3854604-Prymnesium_polylepis.2